MSESFLTTILPQLAAGAAHTGALGFAFDGLHDGEPRIRVPWREDLVGDAENYELLDMDDFLPAAEQPKPMFTYPRRDAHASQQD